MRAKTRVIAIGILMFASAIAVAAQRAGNQTPPPDPDAPKSIAIKDGAKSRELSVAAIKKAVAGRLTRYGQDFDYTPFSEVLKLAGIPAATRVRVVGEEETLILQSGSTSEPDPVGYAVIFNPRGFPVLTPIPAGGPGSRPASGPSAGIPPPGSGGGVPPAGSGGARPAGSGGALPPPPGSGGGAAGTGNGPGSGPGPGAPAGFGQLQEVRRFDVIEIVR